MANKETYPQKEVQAWISNDEGLYMLALRCKRECVSLERAAVCMLSELNSGGIEKTPSGVRYTKTSIKLALSGS